MIRLSQLNPEWSTKKLGNTPFTIGRYGCTTTCIAMASDYFGCYTTVPDLAKRLEYTSQGLIIWSSIPKVTCFKLETRYFGWNMTLINDGLKDPKKVALIEVNNTHWLIAVGKDFLRPGHYMVYDPLGGIKVSTKKYGKITGGAILSRK